MAIISGGRIVLEGTPDGLTRGLEGRIWRKTIDKRDLADFQERLAVISNRLKGGHTLIHVLADSQPEAGFEPIPGGLEDLYFATLDGQRRGQRSLAAS
jgi:hypothetical protein